MRVQPWVTMRHKVLPRTHEIDQVQPIQWYRGGQQETRLNQYKPTPSLGRPSSSSPEDPMMDFRARLVHQQAEAAERRRVDLAEQSSRLKTPEERIRIWERIHEVTLPKDPAHRLVEIIATNTGLTDADVRDEQQRRAMLRAAV